MLVLEAMGRALPMFGVTFMTGLPGSGNYELVHAAREAGVRYLGTNHEAGAVGAADGWSRVTGAVGCVMLSQGPGLTNGLTAMTEAVKSRTRLVLVVIDSPRSSRHGNLNIDQTAVCSALGAGIEVVRSAGSAVTDLGRSLRRSSVERRPVVLMVPLDLVHEEFLGDLELSTRTVRLPDPPWPSSDAVKEAADVLHSARRPVVLAGRGACGDGARAAMIVLAERSGALLAGSAPGKGIFAGESFDLGISGSFASPLTGELLRGADVVVAFGASLNAWTTGNGAMIRKEARVIQVDVDPTALGTHRPIDVGVHGDARETASQIVTELEDRAWSQEGYRTPEVARALRTRDPRTERDVVVSDDGLDPGEFTLALNDLLPTERTVTVDSGHFMGWPAKYLDVCDAAGFVYPQSFQSVGLGLATSIGAAIARPERISVLAIGDGGYMLSPQEVDTAVRHRLALLVVVYNDGAYGAEVHRFEPLGLRVDLVRFPGRNFAAMAKGAGAQGLSINDLTDLESLRPWLSEPAGPMVLDVRINPNVVGNWVANNSKAALA